MKFKKGLLLLALVMTLIITGCSGTGNDVKKSQEFDSNADFNQIIEQAKGSTVTFYGWGGDEDRNKWVYELISMSRIK